MPSFDFTAANGTALFTYSSDLNFAASSTAEPEVQNNLCRISSDWAISRIRAVTSTADECQADFIGNATLNYRRGIMVRCSATTQGYKFIVTTIVSTNYTVAQLYKNGSWAASSLGKSVDGTTTFEMRLTAVDNAGNVDLTGRINGTTEITWTDTSSVITSGNIGWEQMGNGAGTRDQVDIDNVTDNVSGGTPVSQTFAAPYEVGQGLVVSKAANVESLQSVSQSVAPALEALQSVVQSAAVPFECRGNALVSAEFITPFETGQAISASLLVNIESLQSVAQTHSVPVEALQQVAQGLALNIESVGRVSVNVNGQLEVLARVSRESVAALESLQSVSGTATLNMEANRTISNTFDLNFEALLGSGVNVIIDTVNATAVFTVELNKTLTFGDVVEAEATFADVVDKTITFH